MISELFDELDLESVPAANQSDPWGGYDWSKKSLAVVAHGENGAVSVLYTVGAHVRIQLEEYGLNADDIGIIGKDDLRGLWVWEGGTRVVRHHNFDGEETEDWLEGDLRALTAEELAAVAAGRSPWDDAEWKLPTVPGGEP